MKISKSTFAYLGLAGCLCLVGLVTSVGGQEPAAGQAPPASHGIVGTLDPQTGAFKPLIKPTVVEDLEAAPLITTPTTGTFVVNFTITVKSTLTGDTIACSVEATAEDITSGHIILENASVAATRSSPTAAKCTVTIPYSWVLTTPATDIVSLQYSITAPVGGTSPLPSRLSSQTISNGKVPTSGATTTINLNATI